MVEKSKKVQRVRAGQIEEINKFLAKHFSARRMNDNELAREGHRFAGWFVRLPVGNVEFKLRLLLGRGFPFQPPEIFLDDVSYHLKYPHVEKTGKLCLVPGQASSTPSRPCDMVQHLLEKTKVLLLDSVAGTNREDFISEFQSYWPGKLSERAKPFWSILSPKAETRIVYYWNGNDYALFGETAEDCRRWVKNSNGGQLPKHMEVLPTIFAWLDKPLFPEQYPQTSCAFRRLAKESRPDVDQMLSKIAPQEWRSLPVMLGFQAKDGLVFAGLFLKEPKASNVNGRGVRDSKIDGFRHGKVPADVLLNRYFGITPVEGVRVNRGDASWIHTRGGSIGNFDLRKKKVGIFGCGSLGAEVAFLLAKSGVGGLFLVDNQVLSLDNVGRHLLGVDYVRQNKSDALGHFLQKQLPELSIESNGGRDIEFFLREKPKVFSQLDLVISTTGDWASDCELNVAARDWPSFPPIIFGWTEAYGVAGHALLVADRGGCLACGMSEHGIFQGQVAEWQEPEKTFQHATGCSDFYQPYGVTDVAYTKAMIAELALKVLNGTAKTAAWHSWVGDLSKLPSLNGTITKHWKEKALTADVAKKFFSQDWQPNAKCPFCGE